MCGRVGHVLAALVAHDAHSGSHAAAEIRLVGVSEDSVRRGRLELALDTCNHTWCTDSAVHLL